MHNFVLHNPTKILFGSNTLPLIGRETRYYGTRVLLVFGSLSLKKQGTYNQIIESLNKAELEVVEFDGIQPNPTLTTAREAIKLAKKENIEVVVAAGGGSVIDTAKAIAAGAVVEHDVWKFFTGKKSIQSSLPVTTVLTIPGSGSEMNNSMVLTNDEKKLKFGFGHRSLFPKVSILDPTLAFTVDPAYTAYGAIDAICHVLEFYMTHEQQEAELQKRFMEGIIKTVMNACSRCIEKPDDYNARSSLLWAAALSLSGLIAAGLGKVEFPMHLLEHSISGRFDTPHGAGLSALLPGWLAYYSEQRPDRVETLAKNLFPDHISPAQSQISANEVFLHKFLFWMKRMGLPTSIQDLAIDDADIDAIAEQTRSQARIWRLKRYSPDMLKTILLARPFP